MDREYHKLFAQMISLARITDGNAHLITPSATELLRRCLAGMGSGTADIPALCAEIEDAKRSMVPDCFRCANPCGKTFPYDPGQIPEGKAGALKHAILAGLINNPAVREDLLYHCLTVVSLEDYTPEDLIPILESIT